MVSDTERMGMKVGRERESKRENHQKICAIHTWLPNSWMSAGKLVYQVGSTLYPPFHCDSYRTLNSKGTLLPGYQVQRNTPTNHICLLNEFIFFINSQIIQKIA